MLPRGWGCVAAGALWRQGQAPYGEFMMIVLRGILFVGVAEKKGQSGKPGAAADALGDRLRIRVLHDVVAL